jgi:hypothetical protein
MAAEWVEVQLRRRGGTVGRWYAVIADPGDMDDMRKLGAEAVRRDRSWQKHELGEYEVRVRRRDTHEQLITFVPREA